MLFKNLISKVPYSYLKIENTHQFFLLLFNIYRGYLKYSEINLNENSVF